MKTKESSSISKSLCPVCNGAGKICKDVLRPDIYGEGAKTVPVVVPCPYCQSEQIRQTEVRKAHANIPLSFSEKLYDSFNWQIYRNKQNAVINTESQKTLIENLLLNYREWKKAGYGLYISSRTKGSGKTFLASVICNELMKNEGIKTRFVSASQLLDIAQSGDKESPDEYKREPIKLLCNCELLVLDDIGQKQSGQSWLNDILFTITDERMNKKLVTIFTSNVPLEELQIESRISERINKMSIAVSLPEFNVRTREAYQEKTQFLKNQNLIK